MPEIYQTENFIVEAVDKPHITRTDGGHIRISPKVRTLDRTKLSPKLAIEYMRLTMVVGEAMATVMNRRGVDIGRINYQDNGNWSVFQPEGSYFHLHLYGRAKSARIQKWGEMVFLPKREESIGFFDSLEPFNEEDIIEIRREIEEIFKRDKYLDTNWRL